MFLTISLWLSLLLHSGAWEPVLTLPVQIAETTAVTHTMAVTQTVTLSHTVQPGETLSLIAIRYNVTTVALAQANQLSNPNLIYAGQTLLIPVATAVARVEPIFHLVQPGQTLSGIAAYYGVSPARLVSVNAIPYPDYIQAGQWLRIPEADEATAVAPKRIVVDLSEQHTYAYVGETITNDFVVSTGQPGQETVVGDYYIQNKLPTAYAYTWGLEMSYWMGIYWAGPLQNGFHALPTLSDGSQLWRGYLGTPISYGCIVLSPEDAQWLYNWADVGTAVTIQP